MTDTVRCPACRGSKKVAKLGGIVGECNTCEGKGNILLADKPKPVITVADVCAKELINLVADCVPSSTIEHKASFETLPKNVDIDVKVDGKKALYMRKKA